MDADLGSKQKSSDFMIENELMDLEGQDAIVLLHYFPLVSIYLPTHPHTDVGVWIHKGHAFQHIYMT